MNWYRKACRTDHNTLITPILCQLHLHFGQFRMLSYIDSQSLNEMNWNQIKSNQIKHVIFPPTEQDSKDVSTPGKHFRFDSDDSEDDNDKQVEMTKVTEKVNGSSVAEDFDQIEKQNIVIFQSNCNFALFSFLFFFF